MSKNKPLDFIDKIALIVWTVFFANLFADLIGSVGTVRECSTDATSWVAPVTMAGFMVVSCLYLNILWRFLTERNK